MASKKEILDEINFLSDRISTQVRTVALSVMAFVWLFLAGGNDAPVLKIQPDRTLLLVAGTLCLATLLFDYLQYVMGYFESKRVLRKGEREKLQDFKYDYGSTAWQMRTFLFGAKQILVVIGLVCLCIAVGGALVAEAN